MPAGSSGLAAAPGTRLKLVLPGGSGQVGHILRRAFLSKGYEVITIGRAPPDGSHLAWDGRTVDAWADALDGADVVINLAGRSVNCRYTAANLRDMLRSRVDSTRAVGLAIGRARRPPRVWLQMSTATIYAHRFDAPNDEATGMIGGHEPDVPAYWRMSIDIAKAWEAELQNADTPRTRKVALRAAMVMSADRGGIFSTLLSLTRYRLGGSIGGGQQYVSWIHERDFTRAVEFLIARDDIDGPVNIASPNPIPQRSFMAALRKAWGIRLGLPATKWMAQIGAFLLRTDAELILKSRRVVPGRLLDAGFVFDFPEWSPAAEDLIRRVREDRL